MRHGLDRQGGSAIVGKQLRWALRIARLRYDLPPALVLDEQQHLYAAV